MSLSPMVRKPDQLPMKNVAVERLVHPLYGTCAKISNPVVELYVSLDFGPRILHYSLCGGANVLFFNTDPRYVRNGPDFDRVFWPGAYWNTYGGNRTWVAPHSFPHAFYPDNDPVGFEVLADGGVFLPPPRKVVDLQIELKVRLDLDSSGVEMTHSVKNLGRESRKLAVWSVTCMAPGGIGIVPQPTNATGVLPNRRVAFWPYTDMADPRIGWGTDYFTLRQDPSIAAPIKLGINNETGRAAYEGNGHRFVTSFRHDPDGEYPDFGVSYETFADSKMLEIETLSPLSWVKPGSSIGHAETWTLEKLGTSVLAGTPQG